MKRVLVLGMALCLVGCAANLQTVSKSVTVAGVHHQYVFAEGRGVHGATLQVMDRYSPDGQQILARDAAGSPGILSSFLHGGLAGAEMGAGIGAGLAVQGAARVSQSVQGGGATAAGGSGGTGIGGSGGAGGAGGAVQKGAIDIF